MYKHNGVGEPVNIIPRMEMSSSKRASWNLTPKPDMLFIATRVPYPPVTGHYLRTFNILRGLSEHFRVHFFGFRDKYGTVKEYAAADEALGMLCASVHIEEVGAERSKAQLLWDLTASLFTGSPFVATKYSCRALRRAIRSTCQSHEIAVAHADSLPSGQYLIGLNVPKLLTNHNVEYQRLYRYAAQRGWAYGLFLRLQARLTRRYELRILNAIGNCVTVSEDDRIKLGRLVPDARFFVVPNGTDTSSPPLPAADPSARSALWVGGMNDPFNREGVLHFASRILPRILQQVPGFRWVVVGRDPPPLLKTLAEDPDSGVDLAGFVPNLHEVYARSAIVVVPLVSGGGTKLKVLEAMAMGRAVVTTPIGAEGIEARDGVEMEIAATDEEFGRKTADLILDSRRRDHMAAAARKLAEQKYGWEAINQQMNEAVQSAIIEFPNQRLAACAE